MISQTDKASRIFREAVVSAVPPERNIVKYVSDKLLPYCLENKMIVFFFMVSMFALHRSVGRISRSSSYYFTIWITNKFTFHFSGRESR